MALELTVARIKDVHLQLQYENSGFTVCILSKKNCQARPKLIQKIIFVDIKVIIKEENNIWYMLSVLPPAIYAEQPPATNAEMCLRRLEHQMEETLNTNSKL